MLDIVPCEVKGKLITGFKDNSLRSLLQLSFRSLPHGSYQLNISIKQGQCSKEESLTEKNPKPNRRVPASPFSN